MQSSSQGYQSYQGVHGYPYMKPAVIEVPTIDAETASRWNNLPRRPVGGVGQGRGQYGQSSRDRDDFENNPVVYIDLPQAGSQVSQSIDTPGSDETSSTQNQSNQGRQYQVQGYPYVRPVVIEVPTIDAETASRYNNLPRRPVAQSSGQGRWQGASTSAGSSQYNTQQSSSSRPPIPQKDDIDETPVVYIDLPESGSQVSQSIDTPGSDQPEFVQDTILYDPFENRRIDIPKDDARSMSSTASESNHSGRFTPQQQQQRVPRPNYLNLGTPGGSSSQSPSTASRTPGSVPAFMTKESLVYGGHGSDGFPVSPIPISEFPEPPPAYTENATPQSPRVSVQEPPPRTQVILPDMTAQYSPTGLPNCDRKNLTCQYCGVRVQTLVIREVGCFTHFMAIILFIFFMPLVIIVYFSDCFKHYNHYCPNCNKFIGHEYPIFGRGDIVLSS